MIDISLELKRNLITYPGDLCFESYPYKTHPTDHVHITRLLLETHTGTHFDAPFHATEGTETSGKIKLEKFIGPCTVCEVKGDSIKLSDLPKKHQSRILFKTKNSGLYDKGQFEKNFCYLSMEAAKEIAGRKIDLVGIDYLSIEEFGTTGMNVHRTVLSSGAVIVEGLNLNGVTPGDYELICLPLRIDTDGSPCRAILR
ncbi:MAG: cyclase family protein [Candidatus Thermoplasmatota archaeon]|nr:cyclase family protein [Candidatus Thermoplasmatota archaeon]